MPKWPQQRHTLAARYIDYTHINQQAVFRGHLANCRSVPVTEGSRQLAIEYALQRWLQPLGVAPAAYALLKAGEAVDGVEASPAGWLMEEYIAGERFGDVARDSHVLRRIGAAVRSYHDLDPASPSKRLIRALRNSYLSPEGRYDPVAIWQAFCADACVYCQRVSPLPSAMAARIDVVLEQSRAKLTTMQPFFVQYGNVTLIHADLNASNILIEAETGRVRIIDWIDARLDSPSCDVAQFFWVNSLSLVEQAAFWTGYGSTWISDGVLWSHYLLFCLYELARGRLYGQEDSDADICELWCRRAEDTLATWPGSTGGRPVG